MNDTLLAGALPIVARSIFGLMIAGGAAAAATGNMWRGSGTCDLPAKPFCDAVPAVPPGWIGPVFRLSQNYPTAPVADAMPWMRFDPKTSSGQYMAAVLQYFYEGNLQANVESSFDPSKNQVRRWFNAPWQAVGLNGREFVHGLTRERTSRPCELAATQQRTWSNYAVGFYNAPGAYTIGQVWANHASPNVAAAHFPEGTVAAKLLFTTATAQEVPYLAGSPEWSAYVAANPNDPNPTASSPRAVLKVRLLQIDIAVRDSRVDSTTGWVFGTFVYGGGPGGAAGNAGWTNVAPVGLMWGNDPGHAGSGPLSETKLNDKVHMPHVGYQGRLNGPVDNPMSSCMSCHSTAESPAGTMITPQGADPAPWFRNIPSGVPFDAGRPSLDYSLQLSVGLTNFAAAVKVTQTKNPQEKAALMKFLLSDTTPPRDGGKHH